MIDIKKRTSLIYSDRTANKNKYYIAEVESKNDVFIVHMKYGRLGKQPKISSKPFVSEYKANQFYITKVNEKLAKGYEEVDIEDIIFNEGEFFN